MYKGKIYNFLCSNLTMLCILQFRRENPHVNVIEHLNGDSLDDRPSNLLLSTQSANNRRSEKVMEQARKMQKLGAELSRGLNNQQRHEAAMRRRAEREALLAAPRAVSVASAYPEIETMVDLQIDLQLDKFLKQIYDN